MSSKITNSLWLVTAGNTSEKLFDKSKKIAYSLCRAIKINEKAYDNLMNIKLIKSVWILKITRVPKK